MFRLQTYNMSEYLFQADDQEAMLAWIEAIKRNNNPDRDVSMHYVNMPKDSRRNKVHI